MSPPNLKRLAQLVSILRKGGIEPTVRIHPKTVIEMDTPPLSKDLGLLSDVAITGNANLPEDLAVINLPVYDTTIMVNLRPYEESKWRSR